MLIPFKCPILVNNIYFFDLSPGSFYIYLFQTVDLDNSDATFKREVTGYTLIPLYFSCILLAYHEIYKS